jgi:hypothetical protein
VFWSDLLHLFASSSLKTAADSFKIFVCVRHATWDRIPKGSVNILLMLSLVQTLSIYLILMMQNIQYFMALTVLQSCDAVSSISITSICHILKATQ